MRKGIIITIIAILLFLAGVAFGIYDYNKNKTKDSNWGEDKELAYENIEEGQSENESNLEENILSTSVSEEKISPNCVLIEKQYFKDCDHIIREQKEIPEDCINATLDEFAIKYKGWDIEKFSSNEIIVYKEQDGFCGEHYFIKENNGVIAVYTIDENGDKKLKENTDIQTMYFPEEDIEKFKEGIEVFGNEELHSVLEDFE